MEKKYFLYLSFLYSWEGLDATESLINEYLKNNPNDDKEEITTFDIQTEFSPARLFCDIGYVVSTPNGNGIYLPFIGDEDYMFDSELLDQEFDIGEYIIESSRRNGPCFGPPSDYICIYLGDDNSTETLINLSSDINEIVKQELNIDLNFDTEMIETSDEYIYYQSDNKSYFKTIK